ncbi:hypothetical protein BCR32DRAFT_279069 [Anaeromyces robustus]|uniref:Uncharacterized protein n=1 Tax=Anaeromyces robustus TaxID=1754192 RepID=A0A1Y1XA20_9FUNG|nr:hypothetical protein BCR32DRAFT_279069 [Anaeromyces robustus]|eukprot:ORX82276.1 hypothetical protein BCR32DRAFT_279069 [Anaeromyces robustus]
MLCATIPKNNISEKDNNQINLKKDNSNLFKEKSIDKKPESLLHDLSLAFATNNEKGNIIFKDNSFNQNNINEEEIIKNNYKPTKSNSTVDLPLANGSNSSLNSYDISKISCEDISSHNKLSNLSCSSIRSVEYNNNANVKNSLENNTQISMSEDESFIYNSHLSEIDRNEDIKDLRIKLKKAIKSLDKKKNDLTLAAVIGQCLLEANTNLKSINNKLMNHDNDKSSISSSYMLTSDMDPSSSSIINKKTNSNSKNNKIRVYTGIGRQEKNHLNLYPENGSLDENTYNSVVEYHEENYNKLIKKLTDINNQLENSNFDLRRQVNDLEEVVKNTKNKYNRGLLESEKKLTEMEDKLNVMTELNNKLFKDNHDLMKEFSNNNNNKNNDIEQEQKLIDSLYNELYDMQHKIEEVNNNKEKCEKKYEELNKEYIKSQDEIDELKKVQEQNKIIEQVYNEQENRIKELHEYMEYQRDYISRLENQLFFCTFNPVNNQKINNKKFIDFNNDNMKDRIIEITVDESTESDKDESENDNFDDISNENDDSNIVEGNINNIENNRILTNDQVKNNNNKNNNTDARFQNSQLVLYSPNIFHQILSNANNINYNNMNNNVAIDNNKININDDNNDIINSNDYNKENNIVINNSNSKKRISINNNNNNNNNKRVSINGNISYNKKKKNSINGNGDITKQIIHNENKFDTPSNKYISKRRASFNNVFTKDTKRISFNEKPRRKSLNVIPNNQFIYSFGHPMYDSNKLLKSSEDFSNRDSLKQENDESLNIFQQDIKKIFKPRPPVKKMKMNKQEKKMIKKIKMDKLNDIIQTSENSALYTPSSSYIAIPKNNSFNSLSSSSIKGSFMDDSKDFVTSNNMSIIQPIQSLESEPDNINPLNQEENINNENKKHYNNISLPSPPQSPTPLQRNITKTIQSINNFQEDTSDISFLNNIKAQHPFNEKSHETNNKLQKKTFKSIFLKNTFSPNFSSSNSLSSPSNSDLFPPVKSGFSTPSVSSWTVSSSNKNNKNDTSNILKGGSTSTLDIHSFASDLDLSTQIIVKNDSEINNNNNNNNNNININNNNNFNNNMKTSEGLWNKKNNIGNESELKNNNGEVSNIINNVSDNDNNSLMKQKNEETHKNRNKVAKILIKGWIHVVDSFSLFNPYHSNYRLDSYSYDNKENKNDDTTTNTDSDTNLEQKSKAIIPYEPNQYQLPTTHFWNSYY